MRSLLRRCAKCGAYTLKRDVCPKCGGPLEVPHPPKYSPEDRYQIYRIKMKRARGEAAGKRGNAPEDLVAVKVYIY
jgi:Predicted Zn-ribbon RNA-binding protein